MSKGTNQGAPIEALKSLSEQHAQIRAIIRRRTAKGQLMKCANIIRAPHELADPEFETWLGREAGGGCYLVEVRDLHDVTDRLGINPWEIVLPGKPLPLQPNEPLPMPAAPPAAQSWNDLHIRTGDSPVHTPYFHGEKPPQALKPSDFMSEKPDAIALKQVDKYERALNEARERLDRIMSEREKERLDHLREMAALRESVNDRAQRLEREAAEKRMELLLKQQEKPAPSLDVTGLITAIGTVAAPLVTAMMASARERRQEEQAMQQRSLDMQMQSLNSLAAMIKESKSAESSQMQVVMPLINQLLESRSPEKQADLIAAMTDHQLHMMSVFQQYMQSMSGEDDPPWMKMMQVGIAGLTDIAGKLGEAVKPQPLPTLAIQRAMGSGETQERQAAPAQVEQTAPQKQQDVGRKVLDIMQAKGFPEVLRTPEWHAIFTRAHEGYDYNKLADVFVAHIEHLERLGLLKPQGLGGFAGDESVAGELFERLCAVFQLPEEYAEQWGSVVLDELLNSATLHEVIDAVGQDSDSATEMADAEEQEDAAAIVEA